MINELTLKTFDIENPISDSVFSEFFALMQGSFPKEERRTKKAFYELCKSCPYYKIYSLFNGENLIAFFTVWEFSTFRFGDHFAVIEKARNSGIGSMLLSQILAASELPFILEVEPAENTLSARRINFYLRNRFVKNDFRYLLPPMQEGCKAIPMHILSYPKALSLCEFTQMRDTLYKTVYNGFKE